MTRILIVDSEFQKYQKFLEPRFPEVDFTYAVDGEEALTHVPETEVIISIARWFTKEVAQKAKNLKWLQCNITGTDHLIASLADRRDIILTSCRGINGPKMTEVTLLNMLALYRQVRRLAKNQENHTWDRFLPYVLENRLVAIMGLGAIAEHMARCFRALGMTVYGISRTNRKIEGIDKVFSRDELTEAVKDVDFLIALVPFNPETHNIIDAKVFYAMKPSACLINVARGGVVDEAALIDALKNGEISGAGLDVFEESPLPDNSPLWDMENVFITPFTGGRSDKYAERILTVIEPNIRAYLDGTTKYMKNIVQF